MESNDLTLLDTKKVDYAGVQTDPAFIGFRNNTAQIHHYDKYAFFTFTRAIDYFIGPKPGYTESSSQNTDEFNPRAATPKFQIDRINARYHYTISNLNWLPNSDNVHAKYISQ